MTKEYHDGRKAEHDDPEVVAKILVAEHGVRAIARPRRRRDGLVKITVVLKPLEAGCKQRNAASATGEGTDTNPANNLSKADICVAPRLGI